MPGRKRIITGASSARRPSVRDLGALAACGNGGDLSAAFDANRRRNFGSFIAAAQDLLGCDELLIVLWIRRDIGLGAAFFILPVFEMPLERGFALGIVLSLNIVRHLLEHGYVGFDPFRLNRAPGRGIVPRRGEADRAIALAERNDGLHGTFAK